MRPYSLHYNDRDLDSEIETLEAPESMLFGTATCGYQAEGGFNGPDQPKNNWYHFETSGKKERTGASSRFIELYEQDFDLAASIGCNAFRMGIEWARIQPSFDPEDRSEPPLDAEALDTYAAIFAACMERGMTPVVTLFHFTHPLWLGLDFWLMGDEGVDRFRHYAETAVTKINERLIGKHNCPPLKMIITINEPTMIAMSSYVLRLFPRGRRNVGLRQAIRSLENQHLAHAHAYRAIHRIYRDHGWPSPQVTTNGWCGHLYEFDMLAQDLFMAKAHGVTEEEVPAYLDSRRASHYSLLAEAPPRRDFPRLRAKLDARLARRMTRIFGRRPYPRLIEFIYGDDAVDRFLDIVSFDFYDPFLANYFDFNPPSLRIRPDQWGVVPESLGGFLRSYAEAAGDLPIMIVENGMSYRHKDGRAHPRPDGALRPDVLKAHLYEVIKALNEGVRLQGYFYWTMVDNYEWGSFEPRFGLFGVDYERQAARMPTDVFGNNTGGFYRAFINAFRNMDAGALKTVFRTNDFDLLF